MNKYLLAIAFVNALTVSAYAENNSGVSFVKGPLWQAPYQTKMTLTLSNSNPNLDSDCSLYDKAMHSEDGSFYPNTVEQLERYRKLPSKFDYMESTYVAYFVISESLPIHMNVDVVPGTKSKLPFYDQNSSIVKLDINSMYNFKVVGQQGSATAFLNSLNILPLSIRLVNYKGAMGLRVEGRDSVCDLYKKRATIQAQASAFVYLPTEAQDTLNSFYNNMGSQINKITSSNESNFSKAVRLGFRLSSLISPSSGYSAEIEESMLALFSVLFKENSLEYSSVWARNNNLFVIPSQNTSIKAPVIVDLTN